MKKITIALTILCGFSVFGQSNSGLKTHYEKYYKQMKAQGDVQGIMNAMTHLNVLEPSVARRDTLAYLYLSNGKSLQALNTIGVEKNATDSDMNVEIKALALKNLNQPKLALEHYEILFKRSPNPHLAYEMADLKVQTQDIAGAKANISYGLSNVKDDMKRAFYEQQRPYEASLKAAFTYLNGIIKFQENKTVNIDAAIQLMNEALTIDPNFNLAKVSRQALEGQKAQQNTAKN